MAGGTFLGSGLIEQYLPARDGPDQLVAGFATNVLVNALERESRARVVIKQRRFPFRAVMAFRAGCVLSLGKLSAVDVLVTILALGWSRFEVHVHERGLHVRRLVAINAGGRAMRPHEGERSLGVIKSGKLFPRLSGMASFASRRRSISPHHRHACLELRLVGVFVATGAAQILPAINYGGFWFEFRRFLVAVATGNGNVSSSQQKVRVLMTRQCKRGRLVSFQIVAAVTGVEVRSGGKLGGMLIGVTIRAVLEFDVEYGLPSPRNMALRTLHLGMSTLQRVWAQGVVFNGERRRFPALDGMARSALSAVGALGELPVMRIVSMAIQALREDQRLFEVAIGVTLHAVHTRVFSQQRILGLRVIEAFADRRDGNLFPPRGVVARLAPLRETAPVRVAVAIGALAKRDPDVARLIVGSRRVALLTGHLRV